MTLMLDQAKLFEQVGFKPHAGQIPILNSTARFRVASCGRRFGKSEIGGHRLLTEAFLAYYRKAELEDKAKRMEYWIVGPEYSDAEKEFRILWNRLVRMQVPFDKPGTYNDPIGGSMHISLWNGRYQVHAKSAKHPETLVGEGLHGAIIAEAAKVKERVWTKYVRPTLNDFHGFADLTSTPEGKNWFYEAWQRGQDPLQRAWASWRRPAWENPYVYPKGATEWQLDLIRARIEQRIPITDKFIDLIGIDPEVVQLMQDLIPVVFNQEIGADFSQYVGRVFADFDEEIHTDRLTYNPAWNTYAAVDYGFTNPNVWLLIQEDPFAERIHVLGEVYERGLSPEDFAAEIKRRNLCPADTLAFYPDPASPGDTKVLEKHLLIRGKPNTGGKLNLRLDAIRKALRPFPSHDPEQRPRLVFDKSCVQTIRDFNDYRYPEDKNEQDKNAPELPMKVNDHAPEALGRYFAGRFGAGSAGQRRARQRTAEMK